MCIYTVLPSQKKALQMLANPAETTVWHLKCGKSVRHHRVVPCYFSLILFGKVLERCFMRLMLFLGLQSSSRISGTSANRQQESVELMLLGVLWMFHISCVQTTYSQVSFFGVGRKENFSTQSQCFGALLALCERPFLVMVLW